MNFSSTISSDFLKLANLPERRKPNLINFANNDFQGLKESLVNYAKAVYPEDYNYFIESDLGIFFLELIAYMGSVLSLKADFLANENILATARQRKSIKKLLDLIGIKLKGPLSAAADAAITFGSTPEGTVTIPAASRVITISSPEDGDSLTYTLYKVVNGQAEPLASPNSDLILTTDGETYYSDLALQEGLFAIESGKFSPTESIKSIELSQFPVIDGSIEVFINTDSLEAKGAYTQVENIYFASGSTDRVFEVVYNDDYGATIVFGNGIAGISPPLGSGYYVQYRVGGGSRGNIGKYAINASIEVTGADSAIVTNTSLATGGSDAESLEKAKKYAPLAFRRQDRIVTLNDYASFANSFISTWGTVGKATAATRKAYASANVIDIYVLEKASDLQLQKATPTFKTSLLTAINKKKMATDEVVIVDGLIRTVDLVITIKIDEEQKNNQTDIISSVSRQILDFMSVDNREFGQGLTLGELNRKIFEVPQVRYSTIDNFDKDIQVDFNEIIQLNNFTINVDLLQ